VDWQRRGRRVYADIQEDTEAEGWRGFSICAVGNLDGWWQAEEDGRGVVPDQGSRENYARWWGVNSGLWLVRLWRF